MQRWLTAVGALKRIRKELRLPRPAAAVIEGRELGVLRFPDSILGRDGGYSARFQGASVWLFGDTILSQPAADGLSWRSSTWSATSTEPTDGSLPIFEEPVDSRGAPSEFLPFTEEEAAYNSEQRLDRGDVNYGTRWALWPGPIIPDPERKRALIFYGKFHARPGEWNFNCVGRSIAVWPESEQLPVRQETEMLFPEGELEFGAAALAVDGWLYSFAYSDWSSGGECYLGRVALENALSRRSWRFYAGEDSWAEDWREARPVFRGAPMMSAHWNSFLDRFQIIYSRPISNDIVHRTAYRIEGPWSREGRLFRSLPPADEEKWNYSALAHSELEKNGGKSIYVSYYRPGEWGGETRLVNLVFRRPGFGNWIRNLFAG